MILDKKSFQSTVKNLKQKRVRTLARCWDGQNTNKKIDIEAGYYSRA
jgi:hypothetical protein